MKLLKLYKYRQEARTLMDLLKENDISYEERKLTPTEVFVDPEDFEKAKKIIDENRQLIQASSEKWYAVTTAPDEVTAEIIKSSLDTVDIPCVLKGLAVPYGEPIIMGQGGVVPMEVLVPESCYDRAKEIIETHLDEEADEAFVEEEKEEKE
ncbi:MAG TPA: DUF2007 domain-containing protein [Thermotogota bacterium]|nr:DUF2007 domain-containing protein [Thermotogota bacterium]HPJ88223.1 DUF2007 domain-containing protein [Thermotogota bacterium]HPR96072.1 DUF2007 domain-containing protein [Thermotogota bacterium]